MFGTGTACVVCPIDGILYKGQKFLIPTMTSGATIMSKVSKELLDIQYGRVEHEWTHIVDSELPSVDFNQEGYNNRAQITN